MFDYLNFFNSLLRFGIKPGLERMQRLMDILKNPEKSLNFVHIAGTNGKGSTSAFIAKALQNAGYKTGLFVSPYVKNFRERIQIDFAEIPENILANAASKVNDAITKLKDENIFITEFEALTAAAFLCFKEQKCDIVVLEVGLGGRFDATNVIPPPLISVITSISLDHTQILGKTLPEIAAEKCGIIKTASPVVTNDAQDFDVLQIIKNTADEKHSKIYIANSKESELIHADIFGNQFLYKGQEYKTSMTGLHQIENAVTAIQTLEVLQILGFKIEQEDIYKGISEAVLPARIQVLSKFPLIILDGSHNDGSTKALWGTIKTHMPNQKILALIGMMEDKDINKSLKNLSPIFKKIITTTPKNDRAIKAEDLAEIAKKYCDDVESISNVGLAFKAAKDQLKDYDALIICGSLYLASEILNII